MFVKSIKLRNYKNHESLEIKEVGQINLITGANAAGKSNLVEAMLRFNGYNKKRESIISFGKDRCTVGIEVEVNNSDHKYRLVATRGHEKNIIKKKQPLGPIPIIHFSPDEGNFFSAGPHDRRNFIDNACAVLRKKYQKDLAEFQKVLKQKNSLLKEEAPNKTLLETLNYQLVQKASVIIKQRLSFLVETAPFVQEAHNGLVGKDKNIVLKYVSKTDVADIERSLVGQLRDRMQIELIRGCCMVGPQRDDFSMIHGDTDVGQIGSQGEKKTAALALKIGQIQLLRSYKIKPVLVLDDALSELDPTRRQHLLDMIPECEQVFITATDENGLTINRQTKRYRLPAQ